MVADWNLISKWMFQCWIKLLYLDPQLLGTNVKTKKEYPFVKSFLSIARTPSLFFMLHIITGCCVSTCWTKGLVKMSPGRLDLLMKEPASLTLKCSNVTCVWSINWHVINWSNDYFVRAFSHILSQKNSLEPCAIAFVLTSVLSSAYFANISSNCFMSHNTIPGSPLTFATDKWHLIIQVWMLVNFLLPWTWSE